MRIDGTVTDPSGRPVAGAVVALTAAPAPVPDIAALTDGGGRFSLEVPVPGDYRVSIRGVESATEVTIAVGPHDTRAAIELPT